jgi:hypothetical protein
MADDALTALLKRAKLTDPQRAGLWDMYSVAKDESDLAARLQSMDLPKELKAELWDLKSGVMADDSQREQTDTTPPSEGYWEDRGIGGKVWHPASGVKERDRADVQVLGVPPELAAIGASAVGRAVVAPGLNAAGRVLAGATAAAGQAAPILKYEATRQVLKHAGLPEPLPTIGGLVVGGLRRGGAAKEATAVAEAAETTAAETTPLGFPKPTGPAETPLEFSRRLKAEHQAKNIPPFGPSRPVKVDPEAFGREFKALAKKPKLTADEMVIGAKYLQSGMKAEQVWDLLLKRRELPAAFRALPTDANIAATIGARNATGKWPQP